MNQTAIMISVAGEARADIMITEGRIYYHYSTTETATEKDLPGVGERYLLIENRIKEAITPGKGEEKVDQNAQKVTIFIDNVKYNTSELTTDGLQRVTGELKTLNDEFSFLDKIIFRP